MKESVLLEGRKIVLRDWIKADLSLYKKWQLGDYAWMDYNGPYYGKLTLEEVEKFLEKLEKRINENNFSEVRTGLVIADKESNELIGAVNWYWTSVETNWLCVGLIIYNDAFWSKGLGYEALGLWSEYLFDKMDKIVRLDLRTWSGNHGMMRLADKLGYTLEARFRKARIVKGEYYDSIGYGILREEWEERYGEGFEVSLKS